jgi:hypothetical protein
MHHFIWSLALFYYRKENIKMARNSLWCSQGWGVTAPLLATKTFLSNILIEEEKLGEGGD